MTHDDTSSCKSGVRMELSSDVATQTNADVSSEVTLMLISAYCVTPAEIKSLTFVDHTSSAQNQRSGTET